MKYKLAFIILVLIILIAFSKRKKTSKKVTIDETKNTYH